MQYCKIFRVDKFSHLNVTLLPDTENYERIYKQHRSFVSKSINYNFVEYSPRSNVTIGSVPSQTIFVFNEQKGFVFKIFGLDMWKRNFLEKEEKYYFCSLLFTLVIKNYKANIIVAMEVRICI